MLRYIVSIQAWLPLWVSDGLNMALALLLIDLACKDYWPLLLDEHVLPILLGYHCAVSALVDEVVT
jgi:hypothetical protein